VFAGRAEGGAFEFLRFASLLIGAAGGKAFGGSGFSGGDLRGICMLGMLGEILFRVIGESTHHFVGVVIETRAAGIADGEIEHFESEVSASDVNTSGQGAREQAHERELNRLFALEMGDGFGTVNAAVDSSHETSVEVAEVLAAQGGRAAAVTGDQDVGAALGSSEAGHRILLNFFHKIA